MLISILVLSVIAFVVFLILMNKRKDKRRIISRSITWKEEKFSLYTFYVIMSVTFGFIIFILIIAICCLLPKVATVSVLEKKIVMYQEENANIEQNIDNVVKEYLEYESDTFKDLKTEESSITLVTLFPELKSDTLVQQQLEIYTDNNNKIKSLKEEKINIDKIKWILYFGK